MVEPGVETNLHYSVVVPTRNRPHQLDQCLAALAGVDYPPNSFEVLVVDDGSSESPEQIVANWCSRLPVRLLVQPHAGPAAARNLGSSEARGQWLVFLDDDCRPAAGWLRGFAGTDAAAKEALGGSTENGFRNGACSVASQHLNEFVSRWWRSRSEPLAFFPSNNFAVSREAFRRMGGFCEKFALAAAEDREFCYRWLRTGGQLKFVPGAAVSHFHHLTLTSFWRQHFNYGRGARTFRAILVSDRMSSAQRPRFSFYASLLMSPLRAGFGWKTVRTVPLLVLALMANVAGFFSEYFRPSAGQTPAASVRETPSASRP